MCTMALKKSMLVYNAKIWIIFITFITFANGAKECSDNSDCAEPNSDISDDTFCDEVINECDFCSKRCQENTFGCKRHCYALYLSLYINVHTTPSSTTIFEINHPKALDKGDTDSSDHTRLALYIGIPTVLVLAPVAVVGYLGYRRRNGNRGNNDGRGPLLVGKEESGGQLDHEQHMAVDTQGTLPTTASRQVENEVNNRHPTTEE